jgi:hypothetical protein
MPYKLFNAPMPTTGAIAPVTIGAAGTPKTLLQIATSSTGPIQVMSWGYTCNAVPGSTGGQFELLQTDVAATVTAHVAANVYGLDPNAQATSVILGSTTGTGYTATAEGVITATRVFDSDLIPPTAGAVPVNYDYQFVLDERPIIAVSKFLRVRATFAAAVGALVWVCYNQVG